MGLLLPRRHLWSLEMTALFSKPPDKAGTRPQRERLQGRPDWSILFISTDITSRLEVGHRVRQVGDLIGPEGLIHC